LDFCAASIFAVDDFRFLEIKDKQFSIATSNWDESFVFFPFLLDMFASCDFESWRIGKGEGSLDLIFISGIHLFLFLIYPSNSHIRGCFHFHLGFSYSSGGGGMQCGDRDGLGLLVTILV